MYTDLLKEGATIIEFPISPIMAGITTTLFGDFRPENLDTERRIKVLQELVGASCHGQLIPDHGTKIAKFITGCADEAAIGDAVIYGNDKIGYLAIVHCSWITLSKGILYKTIERLDKINFWDFGQSPQAFIYPGICQLCYEVSHDVVKELLFGNIYNHPYFQFIDKHHWLLNLSGYIRHQLIEIVMRPQGIRTIATCSAHSRNYDQYLFYSHRARQEKERNAIFAKLPDDDKLIIATTGDCPYVIFWALPK